MMKISDHRYREPQEDDRTITHEYVEADCALETEISHLFCDAVCSWWKNSPEFFERYAHAAAVTLITTGQKQDEVEEELDWLREVMEVL
jgi:hypothetical protein